MAILVTGGAGYIGSHMVIELVENGHDVVVLDNLVTGFRDAVNPAAKFIEGDVSDDATLDTVFSENSIDAVIHFAGSIVVPESVTNPLKYYGNNTAASRTLIEACVRHGVKKFIFSSTAAVYGDPEVVPIGEDAVLSPVSPYGTSKWMTELMLKDVAAAHDFSYVALRYFNVAGADPEGRTGQSTANATHLIKVACQAALGRRSHLSVFGNDYDTPDGTGLRDYIHVSDLAAAHRHALAWLDKGGESGMMNCGYGHGFSVLEVIESVKRVTGVDFQVKMEPRRAGDSPKVVAKVDKIRASLGWEAKYDDLDTIVAHAYAWEKGLTSI
ncbi:UDP-glucose 4-epimerase GalE [Kordiimonas gwangyangensis]|uniref:UDP-glucose 4-epimerase GalE n=1 Tax=Kordiimonas gwangyangensis TaxID=288022 RepID=UPI00037805FB|nr:UDP-glucose 4-epimerase GalE [Kordiimonas gwangyangensis]